MRTRAKVDRLDAHQVVMDGQLEDLRKQIVELKVMLLGGSLRYDYFTWSHQPGTGGLTSRIKKIKEAALQSLKELEWRIRKLEDYQAGRQGRK